MTKTPLDAVVVGSGPNGLAAAITLARSGLSVTVVEASNAFGGGMRSEESTLPGFIHDVCSAVHPLAASSPFFRSLSLDHYGLEWVRSPAPLGHAVGDTAVMLEESVEKTAAQFGRDEARYRRVMGPLVRQWRELFAEVLQPAFHFPKHPLLLARFGAMAVLSAEAFARGFFRDQKARALFGGIAAHANAPLDRSGTASIGLMLAIAGHAVGWPLPRGGARSLARAMRVYFESQGGHLETGREIRTLKDLPSSRLVFFDLPPSRIRSIFEASGETALASRFTGFRHGRGVFKMDWALSAPIPWRESALHRAATVHLGGPLDHLVRAEAKPTRGEHPKRPFVLLSQPTLFDPTRAPSGQHVAWGYCHVPHGSTTDMQEAIEDEIERYAPGFRSVVLARNVMGPRELEAKNANLVGGDIGGGDFRFWRMLSPLRGNPYEISRERGFFICSASTPPGPGVHGMCGYEAVQSALVEKGILPKPKGHVSQAGLP